MQAVELCNGRVRSKSSRVFRHLSWIWLHGQAARDSWATPPSLFHSMTAVESPGGLSSDARASSASDQVISLASNPLRKFKEIKLKRNRSNFVKHSPFFARVCVCFCTWWVILVFQDFQPLVSAFSCRHHIFITHDSPF